MDQNKSYKEGQILRLERIRQNKGIKEIAGNICSVSTLSKIERGRQKSDPCMLTALYKALGISYENGPEFIAEMSRCIKEYFHERLYNFDKKSLKKLEAQDKRLTHSPLFLEWTIIKGLEYRAEDTLALLEECKSFMDEEQLAWFYLIHRYEPKKHAIEKAIRADKILQNSYGALDLMWKYWKIGEYEKATIISAKVLDYALSEGNVWSLSQVFSMRGSIYSCYNMEELMVEEYQKAINLLKNTNWLSELEGMYYNMGATYISLENYDKAREYLYQCTQKNFNLYHKKAVLEIKTENTDTAMEWIEKMDSFVSNRIEALNKAGHLGEYEKSYCDEMLKIAEITRLQATKNEDSPRYIPLLEAVMKKFLEEGRYGYMIFHKNALKDAYVKNRRYKEALSLEAIFSSIRTKKPFNV